MREARDPGASEPGASGRSESGRARGEPTRSFSRGVAETLGFIGAFVGVGLGATTAVDAVRSAAASPVYSLGVTDSGDCGAPVWLVDGYNVLSVGLLAGSSREGWWRSDRRRALLERSATFDDPAARVWVVFDGPSPADARVGRTRVVFAASADVWLLERVRQARDPGALTVVTADRRLAARLRRRGVAVVTPGAFLARCPVPEPHGPDAEGAQATSAST